MKQLLYIAIVLMLAITACSESEKSVYAVIDKANGISEKSVVTFHGVEVGKVTDLDISNNRVVVKINFKKDYDIPEDSKFDVITKNLFSGKKSIKIEPGISNELINYGDTVILGSNVLNNLLDLIPSDLEDAVNDVLEEFKSDSLMEEFEGVFNDLKNDSLLHDLKEVLQELEEQ